MRQSGWRSLPPGIPVAAVTSTIGTRLAATFLSFLAGVIAARELGQHGRGILALMIAVPAALSVVGVLGLDTANLRFAGRSHTAFRHIVRLSILFSLVAGTAIAEAWVLAGWRWPFIRLGLSPGLALLSAMICPVAVLVTLLSAAEVGRGRIQIYNLVTAAAMAVYLAAIAALAVSGSLTVVQCFVSYGVSQLLAVVAFLALARKHTHEDGDRIPLQEYRSYSLRAYLPNIAQYGMLRMDVPLIQVLAGTSAVALYAVALPFAEAMLLLPVAVSLVMFPRITSGRLSRAAIAQVSRKVLAGTAALAGVVALVSPVIVPVIYGVAFRGSVAVIWSMLPGIIVFSAGRSMQTFLAATDRLTPVIIASAAGVVIGLVSLLVLTPDLGAAGAGAADSAGYFAYAAVIAGYLRCPGPLIRRRAHAAPTPGCCPDPIAGRQSPAGSDRLRRLLSERTSSPTLDGQHHDGTRGAWRPRAIGCHRRTKRGAIYPGYCTGGLADSLRGPCDSRADSPTANSRLHNRPSPCWPNRPPEDSKYDASPGCGRIFPAISPLRRLRRAHRRRHPQRPHTGGSAAGHSVGCRNRTCGTSGNTCVLLLDGSLRDSGDRYFPCIGRFTRNG